MFLKSGILHRDGKTINLPRDLGLGIENRELTIEADIIVNWGCFL